MPSRYGKCEYCGRLPINDDDNDSNPELSIKYFKEPIEDNRYICGRHLDDGKLDFDELDYDNLKR